MTKEEIANLGKLSRINLTDEEISRFSGEIDAVLGYVSAINEIVADSALTKTVGPINNVFRDDEVTNNLGTTDAELIKAFPQTNDRFLKVKKILNPDN